MRYRPKEVTAFQLPHALTIVLPSGTLQQGNGDDYLVFEGGRLPRIEAKELFEARYEPVRNVERSYYPHWLGGPLGNTFLTDTGLRLDSDNQTRLTGLTSGNTINTTLEACPVSHPAAEQTGDVQTYRLKETATANAT